MNTRFIALLLVLPLIACGGGEDLSDPEPTADLTYLPSPVVAPPPGVNCNASPRPKACI